MSACLHVESFPADKVMQPSTHTKARHCLQWQAQLFKLFPEPMRIRAAQCTAAESYSLATKASVEAAPPGLPQPGVAERQSQPARQAGDSHGVLLIIFQAPDGPQVLVICL